MGIVLTILAALFGIAALVCDIIILIDMFQDEIWKGILGLLCGLYLLWYALFEFEHDWKWVIVLVSLGGTGIAAGLLSLIPGTG